MKARRQAAVFMQFGDSGRRHPGHRTPATTSATRAPAAALEHDLVHPERRHAESAAQRQEPVFMVRIQPVRAIAPSTWRIF
jgi:hypothetical protein